MVVVWVLGSYINVHYGDSVRIVDIFFSDLFDYNRADHAVPDHGSC